MSDKKQYLELEGLKLYDSKIKTWAKDLDEPIDEDIVTNNTVGGLKEGTEITKDTTLVNIIKTMLVSTKDATIAICPSCTISNGGGTSAGSYEVGTTITTSLSSSYTDGAFNSYVSANKTETKAAGCASTGQKYTMGSTEYSADSFVLKQGANTITSTYTYGASTVIPKKSNWDDSDISIPAGSTSNSLTWTGYYNYYEGAVDSIPETINREYALKLNHGAYKTTYDTSMGKKCYIICIPEDKTITAKDNEIGAYLEKMMGKKVVSISDASGKSEVTYYMYYIKFDAAAGLGDDKITITFK